MALRQLATRPDAMQAIGRESHCSFRSRFGDLQAVEFHNDYHANRGPDRCVPHPVTGQTEIAPHPLTPMELIDDACAFEAIADKLAARK